VPDNFADMFAQKMSFSNYKSESAIPAHSPISSTQDSGQSTDIVYSISQHYHHSAHLARGATDILLPDATRYSGSPETPSSNSILTQNGVEPSSLLRSQITLFEQSNDQQRSRLLELWHLAPPEYPANGGQGLADGLGEFHETTLEQEEQLALLRHQRNMQSAEDPNGNLDMDQACGYNSPYLGEVWQDYNAPMLSPNAPLQVPSTQISPLEDQAPLKVLSHPISSDFAMPANDYCHGGFNIEQQDGTEYPGWQLGQQYVEHQYGMFDQMSR